MNIQLCKICLYVTLVFIMYPVISCGPLATGHSNLSNRTHATNMTQGMVMDRLSVINKLWDLIEQKARAHSLKECNTTKQKLVKAIKKRYDSLEKQLIRKGIRKTTKIRVRDFIQARQTTTTISAVSTNYRKVKVQYKNGQALTLNGTGKIYGSASASKSNVKNIIFSIKSNGPNVIMIKSYYRKQFIAMDKHGHIYPSLNPSHEALFQLRLEENHFYTLSSYKYYLICPFDMYLAIRNNGNMRSPYQSNPGHDSTQFLLVPVT